MKVNGESLVIRRSSTVTIRRQDGTVMQWKVVPLRMGWGQRFTRLGMFTLPKPKTEVVKDPNGKVARDPKTGIAKTRELTDDPEYLALVRTANTRIRVLQVAELLRDEPSIEFDTPRPAEDASRAEWERYADGLSDEFEAAGFSEADIDVLLNIGDTLSVSIDTEAAAKHFLPNPDENEDLEEETSEVS